MKRGLARVKLGGNLPVFRHGSSPSAGLQSGRRGSTVEEPSYWERLSRRRLSRRRLLVGAAGVGAGLAAKSTPWFGNHFHLANLWLDQSDPNYGGRSA